jgi:hypothetical protein
VRFEAMRRRGLDERTSQTSMSRGYTLDWHRCITSGSRFAAKRRRE